MNFLAHIYLSGNNKMLALGNFMGDFVKGNDYENFENNDVRNGILLHREIDAFTDSHPTTKQMREMLSIHFNHFSGIICDMYYDYFLAKNWNLYSKTSLLFYSWRFYFLLLANKKLLPNNLQYVAFNLMSTNRLYSYRTKRGLRNALNLMGRTSVMPNKCGDLAVKVLNSNYNDLQAMFFTFFDDAREKFLKTK